MFRCIYLLFFMILPTVSFAEDMDILPYTASKDMVFQLPPTDQIDPEIIKEAMEVGRRCQNHKSGYLNKDCECYAKAYVQERLKDRRYTPTWLENKLVNVCYDENELASYFQSRQNCQPPGSDSDAQKKFCQCYAAEALFIYRTTVTPYGSVISERLKQAHKECIESIFGTVKIPDYSGRNSRRGHPR